MKATNNHDGVLHIAGVDVRPGATVEVDSTEFAAWKRGNAASHWLKLGIVTTDESVKVEPAPAKQEPTKPAGEGDEPKHDRAELFARAKELGLNPNATTSTKKLEEMVADAEEKK